MENCLIKCPSCGNDVSLDLVGPITRNFSQKCNKCNATITGTCYWNPDDWSLFSYDVDSFYSANANKKVVCPNCGQIASNNKNCEHCGSLLVRFPSLGIDLSNTTYLTNDYVLPGLIEELNVLSSFFGKEFLESGNQNMGSPCIELSIPSYPYDSLSLLEISLVKKGCDVVSFTGFEIRLIKNPLLNKLKDLACRPLLNIHMNVNLFDDMGFAYGHIDFGKDVIGTARVVSDIIRNVYRINKVEYKRFYGNYKELTEESKHNYYAREELKDKTKMIAAFIGCLLVVIAILVLIIKLIF